MSDLDFKAFVARFGKLVVERRVSFCSSLPDMEEFIAIWIEHPLTIEEVKVVLDPFPDVASNLDNIRDQLEPDRFKAYKKAPAKLQQVVFRRSMQTQMMAAHYLAKSAALAKLLSEICEENPPETTFAVLDTGWNTLRQFEFWYGRAVEFNEPDRLYLAETIGGSLAKSRDTRKGTAGHEKQKIKGKIKIEFDNWRGGFATTFARKMMKLHPNIEDEKTITGWVREWKKEKAKVKKCM